MKFVVFSVVCLFAVVLAKPASKQKRDILPGDPRYGTDYHHHHHHHHHENEVEVSRALGGYVGSYTVQENSDPYQNIIDFQAPQTAYGPPGHTPGKPIHYPQVGHVPAPTEQHHYHDEVSEPVKYNNQYLAPATESHHHVHYTTPQVHYTTPQVHYTTPQVHYTTPAPYYTTAAPHYTTAAPHYTTAAPHYRPNVQVRNDYLPPNQGYQKSVEGPVTSYGTPVPDYQIPEVQHHDHHVVADVRSTVLGDVSTHVDSVTVAPVHHEEEIVQEVHHEEETVQEIPEQQEDQTYEAPVQKKVETYHPETPVQQEVHHTYHQEAPVQQTYHHEAPVQQVVHQTYHHEAPAESHHSHAETHAHVQPAVHSVKTVKEQVTVHRAVQPAVHHAVQPTVHRAVVQQTVQQPAFERQTYYQQPQAPQPTYSNNYFGNAFGSLFPNFGSSGSGYESTYGTPNFQVSQVIPQIYNPDFGNFGNPVGYGYQQVANVFSQGNHQKPTYQVPQHSVIRTPQIQLHRHVQSQEFPQQVTSFVQSQVVPEFPSYQETTQQVVQQPAVSIKSTQLIDQNNGGYVY